MGRVLYEVVSFLNMEWLVTVHYSGSANLLKDQIIMLFTLRRMNSYCK